MARCETCGNEYSSPIEVTINSRSHTFDCFECAIHALAPNCKHCGCRVIGHGVEVAGKLFCCANCARAEGYASLRDHEDVMRV